MAVRIEAPTGVRQIPYAFRVAKWSIKLRPFLSHGQIALRCMCLLQIWRPLFPQNSHVSVHSLCSLPTLPTGQPHSLAMFER